MINSDTPAIIPEHKKRKWVSILIQVLAWLIVFAFPLLFVERNSTETFSLTEYLKHSSIPVSFVIAFYINSLWLIPKVLFRKKTMSFILLNILLITVLTFGITKWNKKYMKGPEQKNPNTEMVANQKMQAPDGRQEFRPQPQMDSPQGPQGSMHHRRSKKMFWIRDVMSLFFIIGLACTIKLTERYDRTEKSLQEAEEEKAKAELDNLKNQLNPHFMLNTLNNIYALIAIDQDKAQEAVHQLSKLLRHVLYENQEQFVLVQSEIDFLKNYIELMKIRLASNCKVTFNADIPANSKLKIAPLLLISLVENSFKHGVSPTRESYIFINITEIVSDMKQKLSCLIENSYYPKDERDKSGSGIGLKQVQIRLDLLYKGHYTWNKGIVDVEGKGKMYRSVLELDKF
ncbi:MAG TPA: sensor histidine kinase [Candidatus Egerieousia sp.]|nr:sensor histidine kinase [Candidatus Egerieousia sp.]